MSIYVKYINMIIEEIQSSSHIVTSTTLETVESQQ